MEDGESIKDGNWEKLTLYDSENLLLSALHFLHSSVL